MRGIFGFLLVSVCLSSAQAVNFDADVPKDIQQQLIGDMNFMASVQGSRASPLHRQVFGQVNGPLYQQWFESRITGVGLDDCGSKDAVACVMPFYDANKMWLTNNYIKFSHPQVARLMVVYHEARHSEGKNGYWHHANCPRPFKDANGNDMKSIWTGASLAGQPACDVTPFGSYGSSTILLRNIAQNCESCTEKVRMDAQLYADDQLNRVIDVASKQNIVNDR